MIFLDFSDRVGKTRRRKNNMKVADVMSTRVEYVTTRTTIKELSRIIFGRGINGVPVCKGKKVVGFITERDILSKFYPSMQEYIEDTVHAADFEEMEKKVSEILTLKAEDIMSKNPKTVTAETPLLRAQSLMFVQKIGRLPVIDERGNLIGMISKGDIFRTLVGDKLPFATDEEYHDWLSKHYDFVVEWEKRLGNEVPDLTFLFNKEKVKNILDIGFGTGEHDIALAGKGFNILGVESSSLMQKSAKEKLDKLPESIVSQIEFAYGDITQVLKKQSRNFEAAIFMGNAFAHLDDEYKKVLAALDKKLPLKGAIIVMQIINYEKVFKVKNGFLDLNIVKSKLGIPYEHAFLEFYSFVKNKKNILTLNMAIFDSDGKKWRFRTMNSTPIVYLDRAKISGLLKKHGFKNLSFHGSNFLGPLFKDSFKPLESDWLNIVAKR